MTQFGAVLALAFVVATRPRPLASRALKAFAVAMLCTLLAGCAAPVPSSTPTESPTATITPSPITTPSPSPSPTIAFTCYRDPVPTQRDPAYLSSSYCPAEEVAVRTAVAHLGYPIQQIAIAPTIFPCGMPWPSGDMACPPVFELAAFVTFGGTKNVAALTIALLPNGSVVATVVAFEVPPTGWSMP